MDSPSWVREEMMVRTGRATVARVQGDITFVVLLNACAKKKDLYEGTRLHATIRERLLLEKNPHLATALIRMYSKCGLLGKAQQVLEDLPVRDAVSWSALIEAYTQHGQYHKAFNCFERMKGDGFFPNVVTFTSLLKACGNRRSLNDGAQIHEDIVSLGLLESDVVLGTALVDMYAKCGAFANAVDVFEQLPFRDVVSWSALISGYAEHGQSHKALDCFEQMQHEGLCPDVITFISLLKSCSRTRSIRQGQQIHRQIVNRGILLTDIVLGSTLVDMYAKCGLLEKAQEVLEELPVRNVVSWSSLIAGHVEQGEFHEALICFERMQNEGHPPNVVTFICLLKACGSLGDIGMGEKFHEQILSEDLLAKDIALGTALVDMYAKCGILTKALKVLKEIPTRNVISWNALIAGYAEQGQYIEALNCFDHMRIEGMSPNTVTFTCMLKACGRHGAIDKGKQIHEEIISVGSLEKDLILGNALIDMYAKCGMLARAQQVLEELHVRDVVSWNGLIAGYVQQGHCHEAFKCFKKMQNDGLSPTVVTLVSILKACSDSGAIAMGEEIHEWVICRGWLEKNIFLGNTLTDMYAKCGMVAKAQGVLDGLLMRNVVSWSALITGYAQQGDGYKALSCFKEMQSEGIYPNEVTFSSVLSACYHSGLLEETILLFDDMTRNYGITPSLEHETCMVVALGCTGKLDEAVAMIKAIPPSDSPAVWIAFLSACRKWERVNLARLAFDQAVQRDVSCAAAYVLMASIFADVSIKDVAVMKANPPTVTP